MQCLILPLFRRFCSVPSSIGWCGYTPLCSFLRGVGLPETRCITPVPATRRATHLCVGGMSLLSSLLLLHSAYYFLKTINRDLRRLSRIFDVPVGKTLLFSVHRSGDRVVGNTVLYSPCVGLGFRQHGVLQLCGLGGGVVDFSADRTWCSFGNRS